MKSIYYGISLAVILAVSFFIMVDSIDDASAYKSKKTSPTASETRTQLNKYANYVHLQPEWNSYPLNMIFDVSVFWNRDASVTQEGEIYGGAKDRVNGLQYLGDKSYVEVRYDYLDCSYQWFHYVRSGLDIINSHFDYWSGKQLGSEYDSALFTKIPSTNTLDSESFLQFIPICTSQDVTSFEYGVRIDDKDLPFDVYFVPSMEERLDYLNNDGFEYYAGEECSGLGYTSFGGTCENVGEDSGLLLVIPDALEKPLTKISVKLKELKTVEEN